MATKNWKLSYAGVTLPAPGEGGLVPSLQPIDSAERNANGDMLLQSVALKRTISVTWPRLTGSQVQSIFSVLESNRSGKLIFWNPAKNAPDELNAYYGAGASVTFTRYDDQSSAQLYSALTVNFIEM